VALPLLATAAVAVAAPQEPAAGETSATPQVPRSRRLSEGTAATVAQATLLALAVQDSLAQPLRPESTVLAAAAAAAVVVAAPALWPAV
jgi:preprotein translocase subunit Sec61beta